MPTICHRPANLRNPPKLRQRGSLLNGSKLGAWKTAITPSPGSIRTRGEGRLDGEHEGVVEVASEDQDWPFESAFGSGDARGWCAGAPGRNECK